MDQCMIRLPHEFPVGTTVTLLGKDGDEEITAIELAKRSETIAYEVALHYFRPRETGVYK